LQNLAQNFQAVFDYCLDAIIIVKKDDAHIIAANASVQRVLGYNQEYLIGESFSVLFPIVKRHSRDEWLRKNRTYDAVFTQNFLRGDGSNRLFDMTATPIGWGNEEAVLITIRDISERLIEENERERLLALDTLTEIPNRRSFESSFYGKWNQIIRENYPISLMLLDIDYFKQYNDTYGHQAGDICLKKVAKTIESFTRTPHDIAARYGGEEFAVLLLNSGLKECLIIAERIKEGVQRLGIPHKSSSIEDTITVSIGAAVRMPLTDFPPDYLISSADRALYRAKALGRNRVEVAKL